VPEKEPKTGLERSLENLWSGRKIMKKAHAGRGQKTKWEIPDYAYLHSNFLPDQPDGPSVPEWTRPCAHGPPMDGAQFPGDGGDRVFERNLPEWRTWGVWYSLAVQYEYMPWAVRFIGGPLPV
jgi:hypothetical protein